jgi:DNA-directed RNA polymerase III subunit RPC6
MEIDDRKKKRSSSKKRRGSSSDSDSSSSSSSSDSSSMSESSFLSSSASSSTSDSDSDSDSGKKKSKSKANGKKPDTPNDFAADNVAPHSMYDYEHDIYNDADVVYRAVHPPPADAIWRVSEAPCVECPVHTFCSETGPVNPAGCVYYNEWLGWDYV